MITNDIKNLIQISEGKLALGVAITGAVLYKKDQDFANNIDNIKDSTIKLVKIINSHGEKFAEDPNNQNLMDGLHKLMKYITTATND